MIKMDPRRDSVGTQNKQEECKNTERTIVFGV